MALSRTLKQHKLNGDWDDNNATGDTLTAFTPAADSLLLVLVGAVDNNDSTLMDAGISISGGSLTWNQITYAENSPQYSAGTVAFYAVVGGSPVSTTVTLSWSTGIAGNWSIACWEITGQHATPIGGKAAAAGPTDGALTLTLDATPASDSYVFGLLHSDIDGAITATEGSGFTEVGDTYSTAASTLGHSAIQERTGSTSTAAGWADVKASGTATVYSSAAIAVEIKAAAGGGTTTRRYSLSLTGVG